MKKRDYPDDLPNFGYWITVRLKERGDLTQGIKELSKATGVSTSAIYKYMERKSSPTLDVAFRISKELNFSLDYMSLYNLDFSNSEAKLAKWQALAIENDIYKKEPAPPSPRDLREKAIDAMAAYIFRTKEMSSRELLEDLLEMYMYAVYGQELITVNPKTEKMAGMLYDVIQSQYELWAYAIDEITASHFMNHTYPHTGQEAE